MDVPYGAILTALTMVSFIGLRKAGMAHLLMPHQTSIGIGSAWTVLTSIVAAAGFHPEIAPSEQLHLLVVFLPQQIMYVSSLWLRGEAAAAECGLALSALGSSIAIFFLRGAKFAEAEEFGTVMCGAFLVIALLPGINIRIKLMCLLWCLLLGSAMLTSAPMAPMALVLFVEEMSILNVKIQYLATDPSKRKE